MKAQVICHGIPDCRELEDGDLVNVDVTLYRHGFHADTARTWMCGQADAAGADSPGGCRLAQHDIAHPSFGIKRGSGSAASGLSFRYIQLLLVLMTRQRSARLSGMNAHGAKSCKEVGKLGRKFVVSPRCPCCGLHRFNPCLQVVVEADAKKSQHLLAKRAKTRIEYWLQARSHSMTR